MIRQNTGKDTTQSDFWFVADYKSVKPSTLVDITIEFTWRFSSFEYGRVAL